MKISVPMHIQPFRENLWDAYLQQMKSMNVRRVFLASSIHEGHLPELEVYRKEALILKELIALFGGHGIEAAYWGNSIGHGGSLLTGAARRFQEVVGPEGKTASGVYCPLDPEFIAYVCQGYSLIAESGVDLLVLDDDFRLHLHAPEAPVGCFCPLHMEAMGQRIGREISREELAAAVLHGKPSLLRTQWLEVMGDSLLAFAGRLEKAVHAVNPAARLGLCAVMSHWSHEGITMDKLLQTLAGETRPFLRTIGAPYWSKESHHIGWIIAYTRLQQHWVKDTDVEIVAEGDTYPQSRFHCSAAMLHAFHQGLRAAGFPGLLSYSLHFSLSPELEDGYVSKISRQQAHYEAISAFCPEGYVSHGVQPVLVPYNMAHMTLPEAGSDFNLSWPDEPVVLQYLSRMGIPISYEDKQGAVVLTGSYAASLSDTELEALLRRGALIDGTAAHWLMARKIDIGITSLIPVEAPSFEQYTDPEVCGKYAGEYMWSVAGGDVSFFECELKAGAISVTEFMGLRYKRLFPGVIHYENANKQRFCLLPFDLASARYSKQLIYNYARQQQFASSLAWVNRNALYATMSGQPDVYMSCRVSPDSKRLVITVQNGSMDPIKNPQIQLNPEIQICSIIELLQHDQASAVQVEDFVYHRDEHFGYLEIKTEIPPMGFMGVAVINPWG
ncbi:hypothetical protein [Paenibacillus eucommiae]|uniref:Uncharacterized protein n=1 Tax=Paenibacillus eucommiae TaxID=1355755 RepID=A0ABS4J1P8_9BACL|nr:hypothetical protein [Paenibacillus eucommiae]MBP1993747.1 hypothetical protein [Paenibacillus eucommiae]